MFYEIYKPFIDFFVAFYLTKNKDNYYTVITRKLWNRKSTFRLKI